jgi:hypothetical protein
LPPLAPLHVRLSRRPQEPSAELVLFSIVCNETEVLTENTYANSHLVKFVISLGTLQHVPDLPPPAFVL